ncbi:MAG: hypothetical protein WC506_00025 [Candidatus Micrarchaeia archaeon]
MVELCVATPSGAYFAYGIFWFQFSAAPKSGKALVFTNPARTSCRLSEFVRFGLANELQIAGSTPVFAQLSRIVSGGLIGAE